MEIDSLLEKMRDDWDERARQNARHYIVTSQEHWTEREFFASGEETVRRFILTDMQNICQGRDPKMMRVLEIGCGAGRITRALAGVFGEVHGVDVSGEMVALAKSSLADYPNAYVYQNNGKDLAVLPDLPFNFAFSFIVFQHIPRHEVIESYASEVSRVLSSGDLFKFQVQGARVSPNPSNTWVGVCISEGLAGEIATRTNFEMRHAVGAGTEFFWLWFFRQ